MLVDLHKQVPLWLSRPAILAIALGLLAVLIGACTANKVYPAPGTPYQNRTIGYELSYTEADDSVEIELRNISEDMLDVGMIGFYIIDASGIRPIDALAIGERQLEPLATTLISFPKDGDGFIIMSTAGSFVSGEMFEVRY